MLEVYISGIKFRLYVHRRQDSAPVAVEERIKLVGEL